MKNLSDEEKICEFMEPRPKTSTFRTAREDMPRWWRPTAGPLWKPVILDLNTLHEVEARLTDEQWKRYGAKILGYGMLALMRDRDAVEQKRLLHADAPTKIAALAAVVQP